MIIQLDIRLIRFVLLFKNCKPSFGAVVKKMELFTHVFEKKQHFNKTKTIIYYKLQTLNIAVSSNT